MSLVQTLVKPMVSAIAIAIIRARSALFSPLSCFTAGEQGVWYDPSDLSTLFQDAAGTTPVTAAGQPVGLMLDKSKGLVLGPEKFLYGDGSATGWTYPGVNGGSVSSSGGELVLTSGNPLTAVTDKLCYAPLSGLTAGAWYKVTGGLRNISDASGAMLSITSSATAGDTIGTFVSTSSASLTPVALSFKATAATMYVRLIAGNGNGSAQVSCDNISVRELPGNHASQPTASKRPVLSSRVNLVTQSESLASGDWVKVGTTPTQVSGAVWKLVPTVTNTSHSVSHNLASVTGLQCWTAECKADGLTKISLREGLTSGAYVTVDLLTATMITVGNAPDSYQITQLADGWVRISLAKAPAGAFGRKFNFVPNTYTTGDPNNILFAGDGVSGVLVRYPQCNYGSTAQPYQWITTGTEYDTVGFPWYLKFDGVDDFMSTAAIDFSGTDKLSAWAGVTKLDDTARIVAELSATATGNSGSFYLVSGNDAGYLQAYTSISRGTAAATAGHAAGYAGVPAPDTAALTITHDISGDLSTIKRNGVAGVNGTFNKGEGNFGNYPLYIASRAGNSLFFNGNLYPLVIAGALYDADTVAKMNAWTAKKTGVTI